MEGKTNQTPQRGKRAKAQTAEELKEKYGNKRFTSKTAHKCQIYDFLYQFYLMNEHKPENIILFPNKEKITRLIDNNEDFNTWFGTQSLIEWTRSAYNTAYFMVNTLTSNLSDFLNISKAIIAGEELREAMHGDQTAEALKWLDAITLEAYKADKTGGYVIETLRRNIEASLRYMRYYNAFIELVSEEIKTPEYCIAQLSTASAEAALKGLNEALYMLRETVIPRKAEAIKTGKITRSLEAWTPEELEETLEDLQPVGKDIPPISEARIRATKKTITQSYNANCWHAIFEIFSRGWRWEERDEETDD
jgi:hypothetical protein